MSRLSWERGWRVRSDRHGLKNTPSIYCKFARWTIPFLEVDTDFFQNDILRNVMRSLFFLNVPSRIESDYAVIPFILGDFDNQLMDVGSHEFFECVLLFAILSFLFNEFSIGVMFSLSICNHLYIVFEYYRNIWYIFVYDVYMCFFAFLFLCLLEENPQLAMYVLPVNSEHVHQPWICAGVYTPIISI